MQAVIDDPSTGAAEHRETSSRGGNPRHHSEAPQGAEQTADPALVTSRAPDNISVLPRHISDAPAGSQTQPRPTQRVGRITTSDSNHYVETPPELEARQQSIQQLGPLPDASDTTSALREPQAAPQLQSSSSTQAVVSASMLTAPAAAPATDADQTQAAQLQLAVIAQHVSAAGPATGHRTADAVARPAPPRALNNRIQCHLAPAQAQNMQYGQAPQGHILMMPPGYSATRSNMRALGHCHELPQRLQPAPEVSSGTQGTGILQYSILLRWHTT